MATMVKNWFRGFVRFINNDPRMNRELEKSRENLEFDRNLSRTQESGRT
ncbi:hypothetical protein [Rhizobium leguminosarum]